MSVLSDLSTMSVLIGLAVIAVAAQPADLGTFGSHNDLPNSVSSFSMPAGEERLNSEPFVMAFINYSYIGDDGLVNNFAEEKGKYGEGRIFNVRGLLVHVTSRYDNNDHTACSPHLKGTKGAELPAPGTWLALIKRGNCNFEDKVKHAWMHKALGVIVYNDRDSGSLDKMKIVEAERNITAVFTYKWLGEQMAQIVDSGYVLYTSVSEGRYSKSTPNINRTSVLFVSISFIVLMIISLVWLIFYYVQRFRYLQTKDRKSRQLCSVAKRIIAKIPTKSIKADDKQIENDCCAICIEPYKVCDVIRMLPCRHDFHKSCIDPWLLEHRTCPMCKMDILKHYGFVFTGSQESILQLDLDTEDGEPIPASDEVHRGRSVSPTFVIQLDHEQGRRSSIESVTSIQHGCTVPESCIVTEPDVGATNMKTKCVGCVAMSKNHSVEEADEKSEKQKKESVSLPCTLRKCKGSDSCRGSNNCYMWALDFQQLSKRMDKLDKGGCPKSRTICAEAQGSDNEFLLADRASAAHGSPAEYELSNTKESSRRSSMVEESSDCDFK